MGSSRSMIEYEDLQWSEGSVAWAAAKVKGFLRKAVLSCKQPDVEDDASVLEEGKGASAAPKSTEDEGFLSCIVVCISLS